MKNYLYLTIVITLGLIMAIPQLFHPMNSETDAYSRTMLAAKVYHQGNFFAPLFWGGAWLPLHPIILEFSLLFYDNIYITPRILTLLFSLGSVIMMYFYASLIIKNQHVAILSSLLYMIFPLRYYLSAQTLSESVFVFFFLAAIVFLFKSRPNYFSGLMALNIAHGLRYDSWIMLPLFFWKFWQDKSKEKRVVLIAAACLFPLFWLFINGYTQNNLLYFFSPKYALGQAKIIPEYWNLPSSLTAWAEKIMDVLTLPGVLLATYGGYHLTKKFRDDGQILLLVSAPLYFFSTLIIQVFLGTMEWFPHRYLFTPITMIFPVISFAIFQLIKKFSESSSTRRVVAYFVSCVIIVFSIITLIQRSKLYAGIDYFNHEEILEVLNGIEKIQLSEAGQIFYYHNPLDKRFWLEPVIGYFISRADIIVFPKSQVGKKTFSSGDLIIVENSGTPEDAAVNFPSDIYQSVFRGEKLTILQVYSGP